MTLCKDCKYYKQVSGYGGQCDDYCYYPFEESKVFSYVTGETHVIPTLCRKINFGSCVGYEKKRKNIISWR